MKPTRQSTTDRFASIARTVRSQLTERQVPFLAAGLAFYAVLGIFPAAAATVAVFGLVASRADAQRLVADVLSAAPDDASALLTSQLGSLTEASGAGLGIGVVVSIALLLWSASTGMRALIRSVNLVHGGEPTRSAIELRAISFGATGVMVLTSALIFTVVTILPTVVPHSWQASVQWGRWPVLAGVGLLALTALYEYAPLEKPSSGWLVSSLGAVTALATWLAASFALTFYIQWAGSINETYGTFGAAVVLLLWLYVTAFAILLGAAVDHSAANTTS